MKRLTLLAGIAATICAIPAFAADLSKPVYKAPAAITPAYNWSGFYVGAHLGWGWSHTDSDAFDSVGTPSGSSSSTHNGVIGGGQIGYNFMIAPAWLLGVEADISGSDIGGDSTACSATGCATSHRKLNDFGTVRGRLGYAWSNFLVYGTGGYAWSESETDRTIVCVVAGGGVCPGGPSPSALTGMTAHASGSQGGWTAGGGAEWGFLPNWTARLEYLHLQFDNVGRDFSYPGFPTAFRHTNANDGVDIVRAGVNYLFNWPR